MKVRLIFPKWPKIPQQIPYCLPPLGVLQAAACLPQGVEAEVTDENVEPVDLDCDCDIAGISVMLSCQAPRAYELAGELRARGKTVVLGGQHVTLCPEEAAGHADAVVVGEGEEAIGRVVEDWSEGALEKVYRGGGFPRAESLPQPRRELLDKERLYTYRGWEMVDLVQTSRGCRFDCYPCSVRRLEGGEHRIRILDDTLADVQRCSQRIFIVDNSLDQNVEYQKELMKALAGAGKRIISHPIYPEPEVMELARKAGWWYVYLAVYKISEHVRERVKIYHDNGIRVEGTVMLGLDYHTEDFIDRLLDFLMEIELDLAEFTVLTPFPGTRCRHQMEQEGRIVDGDWSRYDTAHVVFRPRHMSPGRLQELYEGAWKRFYAGESQTTRMGKLLLEVLRTSKKRRRALEDRDGAQGWPAGKS